MGSYLSLPEAHPGKVKCYRCGVWKFKKVAVLIGNKYQCGACNQADQMTKLRWAQFLVGYHNE